MLGGKNRPCCDADLWVVVFGVVWGGVITFICTCTHRSRCATDIYRPSSVALAHIRHAVLQMSSVAIAHTHTHIVLRYRSLLLYLRARTSCYAADICCCPYAHTSCYAKDVFYRFLPALAHIRHSTLQRSSAAIAHARHATLETFSVAPAHT